METSSKARVAELRDLVKRSRGIGIDELAEISVSAESHGGNLVGVTAFDPDGDWCGTGRFRFKWPPRSGSLSSFIDAIINKGIGGNIIINGIPHPEEVLIDVARGAGRR
jgi:hypothetical protein